MALVVCVCSPSTVMTAKGSGRRKTSRLERPSAATTEESLSRIEIHRTQRIATCDPNLLLAGGYFVRSKYRTG